MDFKVASSIYTQPWLIESHAALELLNILQEIKAGTATYKHEPSARVKFFDAHASIIVAPTDRYSAKEHPGYEGMTVAILPILGPLMKEDYCGYYGTTSLRAELSRMNATESIQQIVFVFNTPGGTVAGTEIFAADIKNSPKETIGFIEDMCGSAGYWLASCCQRLYATSRTDIIGSIGTKIEIKNSTEALAKQGIVVYEYTADASKDKNLMIAEALKGRGKIITEEWLNPLNDIFVSDVKGNRGDKLNEATLSGKTFVAEKALELGLIDGIKSFQKEIENLINKNQTSITMKISSTFKNIMSFLGITASAGDVELTPEQLQKVDAVIPELENTKAKVTELETAATATATKVTGLEANVAALTTERDSLKTKNTELAAEVERLGNLDGGKKTAPSAEKDKDHSAEADATAMGMDFQKKLLDQL